MTAIVVSVVLFFAIYNICGSRLLNGIKDFGVSFAYYFLFCVGIKDVINVTVTELPELDIQTYIPFSLEEVVRKLDAFPELFFSLDNFKAYLVKLVDVLHFWYNIIFLLGGSIFLILYLKYDGYTTEHKEEKVRFNKNGKRKFGLVRRLYPKVRSGAAKLSHFFKWFFGYYKEHRIIYNWLLFIWLVNTNILTILVEFFAYYFYFCVSVDLESIGSQLIKLIYDVVIMFWTLPAPIWYVIGYVLFDYIRKNAAYNKLCHMEKKNRGYINSQPVVVLAVGTVGVGKTKSMVDMTLSTQNQFRDKALELMDKNVYRFPEFDWQAFEGFLREAIMLRKIKNLATMRQLIRQMRYDYGRKPVPANIWGYNVRKYPHSYNNGLEMVGIWKVLENYAQEYFVYSMTVSTIISNIAVRSDVIFIDKGYFETFDDDFFKRDPAKIPDQSSYAHIIDWDLFRVGCQMNKENAIAGSFEFGVILASEIGKERQNALELKETKKNTGEANQKNDLFNQWLKMIRHEATIEGYCFVRFFCDEQRPESWGADARDLSNVLHILAVSEVQLALRFCFLPTIVSWFLPSFSSFYHKVKKYGNENIFSVALLLLIVGKLFQSVERKMNTYGYFTQIIGSESGTIEDGAVLEEHEYYLMIKKIYSRRYSTDCFKDVFAVRALEAGTSLYELPTYATDCADLDELRKQNSYFANTFISMYVPATIQYAAELKMKGIKK